MTFSPGLAEALVPWLAGRRWFAGKGRPVRAVAVESATRLREGDPALDHLVVAVDHGVERVRYQLLVGWRSVLPRRLEHAQLTAAGAEPAGYDATFDPELMAVLLEAIAAGRTVGELTFANSGAPIEPAGDSRVMGAEQSNSSVVFAESTILKLYRKLSPGVNPDLEITRALAQVGSGPIVPPLGWMEGTLDGERTTFGMLQPFLRTATDGWALAVTSVRDLYAEGDLHADEVGGDFASEAERLGAATATVHRDLAAALGTRTATRRQLAAVSARMVARLEEAVEVVPDVRPHAGALRAAFESLPGVDEAVPLQRIHGDLHLGQVLRTEAGWVLIDFEGEPARPLPERRARASALRDVAGMLRSFDYAAQHLLADQPNQTMLEYRAAEWASRNREAFCDGYAEAAGADPRERSVLLRAFELDKAVYEVVYEARNRPSWLPIPLGSIHRLVGS